MGPGGLELSRRGEVISDSDHNIAQHPGGDTTDYADLAIYRFDKSLQRAKTGVDVVGQFRISWCSVLAKPLVGVS